MASSKSSKASLSSETTPVCRKCLSTDGALELVTSDERGEYLLQQTFSCTNVQMKLLPEFRTYLCSACKSRFDFLDKLRSIWILNNAKIGRFKEEVDHSDNDLQQTEGVESVTKTEVVAEDSKENYQLSQAVSTLQKTSSTYDYDHRDRLFEAAEGSLKTLVKREPMDDQQEPQSSEADLIQEELSRAVKSITGPDDPASMSAQNNLGIKHAIEARKLNRMDTYGEEESEHTDNLLRSNKRRRSQKDITAAESSASTIQSPKVVRSVPSNKQKHQCPHCSVTCANASKLNIHVRTHTDENPLMCKVCEKTFHTANNLRGHMQIHDKLQCPHCPGKFARQSQLQDHIRTHTGEKPFTCDVCSKAFHAAQTLRIHMKTHDKEQLKCPHCPGKFTLQSRLKDHIRTHTGEKPFVCKVCSTAFHAARILSVHMQTHDKDQHQCPHCSAKFAVYSRLQDHIRTHTGEKPFICEVCDKAFHAARYLVVHMRLHE